MTEKKVSNEELEGMLKDIETATKAAPAKVNIENKPTPVRDNNAQYVSFETVATEQPKEEEAPVKKTEEKIDQTRIMDPVNDQPAVEQQASTPKAEEQPQAVNTPPAKKKSKSKKRTEAPVEDRAIPKPRQHYSQLFSCCKSVLYISLVIIVATTLAWYGYRAVKDVFAFGQDTGPIDITINEDDTVEDVALKLKEKGVIEEPLLFRAYCRVTGADASFHPGEHTVYGNDGYSGLVDVFQTTTARDTAQVVIPEGSTIDDIAKLLEEKNVCKAEDFYQTINTADYDDYTFIAELSAEERADRVYVLEGYLFPDTYEFYQECAPDTVIRTMLDNFNKRMNENTRAQIKATSYSLDEVLIMASIVQREAGTTEDMPRVARVIRNRLERDTGDFMGKLQMDSTREYASAVNSTVGEDALMAAYNTYDREGLPVGAICNPGLAAISAVINPSTEEDIVNCYYFASIIETGETQFFETHAEHQAYVEEHGIGYAGE